LVSRKVSDILFKKIIYNLTTANFYDNQVPDLLYEANTYNPFLILAYTAYDSAEWFEIL